jgi:hypothetical protein
MKRLCKVAAGLALVGLIGCGKSDLNKDLKPVDPTIKPFKMVGDGQGGGADKKAAKALPLVK